MDTRELTLVRKTLAELPAPHAPNDGCHVLPLEAGQEPLLDWIYSGAFGEADVPAAPSGESKTLLGWEYSQPTTAVTVSAAPEFSAGMGRLSRFATHPVAGGDGLGRLTLQTALNEMRDAGYTGAVAQVRADQLVALRLFIEAGFEPVTDTEAAAALWAEVSASLKVFNPLRPQVIPLWPEGKTPLFDPEFGQAEPSITAFPAPGSKGAVVVCPGGGYSMKASHEGAPIARMLNMAGISAYVLDYRVMPYTMPAPILDAQRAIRVVRSLGYEKVGILGFSAGGHLTAIAGTMYDRGDPDAADPVERLSCRPDAFVPCYAVISLAAFTHRGSRMNVLGKDADNWDVVRQMSAELRVTADTPPCFMWHTASDELVPVENSLNMAAACVRNRVPVELHVFPSGAHGLGLAGGTHTGEWGELCQKWLLTLGFGV